MRTTCAVLVFASIALPLLAAGGDVRILKVDPTVLFPNAEPLRQVAFVQVDHRGATPVRSRISVHVEGTAAVPDIEAEIPAGLSRQRVLVPDIQAPATLGLEIRSASDGAILARHAQTWQPQRHWKVHLIGSTHEDLGYDDYIHVMRRDIVNYIDEGRRLSGLRENMAEIERMPESLYHYTMEHLWFQRSYIEERSEAAWREVVEKDLKTGRMHLMGAPFGVHSHWMDYEELARMAYPGRRETKDRFGLDLKTFMMVDNPSLSWSGAQVLSDAGFKYVARWGQGWRTGGNNDYKTTKLPAVFWWLAPDRKNRVLFAWRGGYGDTLWLGQPLGAGLFERAAEELSRTLKGVESGGSLGPYPYDALVSPGYDDHGAPHVYRFLLANWVTRYRYPRIRVTSPTEFFEYIERNYGGQLPVLSGDLNNFSADYATIDPDSQAWKRQAARLLPLAEGLSAVAASLEPSFLPPAATIRRAFTRLHDYDEHCWPTLIPSSDAQIFNTQWGKLEQARKALAEARQSVDSGFSALLKSIPNQGKRSLIVFNPLAHRRTDMVEVAGAFPALIDPDTGRAIQTQALGAGKTVFVATNVPPFGYKIYRAEESASPAPSARLGVGADTLSNQFYTIRFDPKTGTITSIYDKELKRELVDSTAQQKFNQFLYVEKKTRDSAEGTVQSPSRARAMKGSAGPVRAEFVVSIDDPASGAAITQTVLLHDGLKRIDIINDMKHVRAFWSTEHAHRYRANVFFAFPVRVEDFQARVEYPGGVVRPYVDQLRWGSHDYLLANRWVDVSNSSFGVTLAPWNAPTMHFGEIRYNRFSIDYKPAPPYLYSYAYSNRMGDLLALNPEEYSTTVGYSFTSHAGDWDSGDTTRFGWSVASPMQGRILPVEQKGTLPPDRASFLSIDAPNVQLVTLKQSEQPGRGWVIRLVETEGKAADVKLDLPMYPVAGAMECDLVENDRRALETAGRSVKLRIGPYAFATVRVFGAGPAPGQVEELRAEALSDKSVRLRWRAVEGAVYNVFRSEDPAAPPTAYTLVARAEKPEFTDDWLKLDTAYHYHVAAVTASNQQGQVSAQASVRTRKENLAPPRPVEEMGVVRRAKDRLIVYWRKSTDPDVARYFVYRAERPDSALQDAHPVAVLPPSGYFLETYRDSGLTPGKKYYYRVLPEDWAGNRQPESPLASATTPAY
jgi:hypothetical protein